MKPGQAYFTCAPSKKEAEETKKSFLLETSEPRRAKWLQVRLERRCRMPLDEPQRLGGYQKALSFVAWLYASASAPEARWLNQRSLGARAVVGLLAASMRASFSRIFYDRGPKITRIVSETWLSERKLAMFVPSRV